MKKKIAITIDESIYSMLVEESEKDDRSISSEINKILKNYFEKPSK